MSWKRTAITGAEPVTLDEAKDHCYVTSNDADIEGILNIAITAAREYVENRTWRAVIQAAYEYSLDAFPDVIELPKPPCISVTSITYIDSTGTQQTLDASKYEVGIDNEVARIRPVGSWPSTADKYNAVVVTYSAGYADGKCPKVLKQGMLMLIKHLFDNRESVVINEARTIDAKEVPMATEYLIDPFKSRVFV